MFVVWKGLEREEVSSSGGSKETTKIAIIRPLTRLLFCPRMVSRHSNLKRSVRCPRVRDKQARGPRKMEGYCGSIQRWSKCRELDKLF